jgi:flagellar L-ring protein precursor FlgH
MKLLFPAVRHHCFMALAILVPLISLGGSCRAESLYKEESYRPLTGDNKAYRVGDVITVQIYEQSSGTTTTDTSTQRTNNLSAGVTTFNGRQLNGSLAVAGAFDGGGTTQRTNKLLATLSVTVREILPNGDLKVSGQQMLKVNDEEHKANLEGRVRPQDISGDNVVLSTRLADAQITYAGDGELTDRQKRGWWRRLLDGVGF